MGRVERLRLWRRGGKASRRCAGVVLAGVLAGCGGERGASRPIEPVAVLGCVGTWPGQFATPRAIDTDGSTLWVIDKAARVQRIDAASRKFLSEWKTPVYDRGMPVGVTCATLGGKRVLLVADTHEHRVLVYEPGADPEKPPALVATFGELGTGPGQFVYPTDVAVVPDGGTGTRIYVAEYGGNDRISVFDERFTYLFSFGRFGTGDDAGEVEFNRPQAMAFDPVRREMVIADACNHRVGRFTLDGKLVKWIGSPSTAGSGLGQFRYPYGLALLSDGSAMVVEFENCRVQRVDLETGEGIAAYGSPGRREGELSAPWAITLIDRTAYVVDGGNNRVVAFRSPLPGRGVETGLASAHGAGGRP